MSHSTSANDDRTIEVTCAVQIEAGLTAHMSKAEWDAKTPAEKVAFFENLSTMTQHAIDRAGDLVPGGPGSLYVTLLGPKPDAPFDIYDPDAPARDSEPGAYQALRSRDGYWYVDRRDADGGVTVLGANGEHALTEEAAHAIADLLNSVRVNADPLNRA